MGDGPLPYDITRINSVSSYGTFLGIIYFIFGQNPLIGRLISSIFGSFVIFSTYKISDRMGLKKKTSYMLSLIVALTPSYIIFSGLIMRDMLIWVLINMYIYIIINFFKNNNFRDLILSILITLPLILLRKQYAPLFAIYLVLILIFLIINKKFFFSRLDISVIKYFLLLFILSIGTYLTYSLLYYELMLWDKVEIIEYFSTQMSYRTQGGAVYLQNLEYNSYFDLIRYLPLKFIYFVYGPFIWNSHNMFTLLASFENLLVWIFSFILIKNFKSFYTISNKKYRNLILFMVMFIFLGLAANATIDSNFGTAIRHRMIYVPILFIISLSIINHKKKKNYES